MKKTIQLKSGFDSLAPKYVPYFEAFTFTSPIVFTDCTISELRNLGLLIHRAIKRYSDRYKDYVTLLPLSDVELYIAEICSHNPFQVGAFRADFVIDLNNNIKIIEFNMGQPLNGYFTTGFFHEIAKKFNKHLQIPGIVDLYSPLFSYLENYLCHKGKICVIHGDEVPAERKFYPELFEKAGIECCYVDVKSLDENLHKLSDSVLILELWPEEVYLLSEAALRAISLSQSHNAIIPLLFSGSKRFFSLLLNEKFMNDIFNSEEKTLLKKYIMPTYLPEHAPEVWQRAAHRKQEYILKHHFLGRGEEVYAGLQTPADRWQQIITGTTKNYVLQEFVDQKQFHGFVGDEKRNDYITGTLLYINEEFFGPGLFRTHTTPVTKGTGNFRKIAPIVSDSDERIPGLYYL